jgi:nucleoid-associated protein YgaU
MKTKVSHLLATACSLACLAFSISCTSVEDGSEDTSLDASMESAEDPSSEDSISVQDGDESFDATQDTDASLSIEDQAQSEEELSAALDGQGAEETPASAADEPEAASQDPFNLNSNTDESSTAADTQDNAAFDPFATAEPADATDADESSVEEATPDSSQGSFSEPSPTDAPEVSEDTAQEGQEADPFARFDSLIDSTSSSAATSTADGEDETSSDTAYSADTGYGQSSSNEGEAQTDYVQPRTSAPLDESSNITYLVAPGDSLYEIAHRIYGNSREWMNIAQVNSLSAPYLIYPGDELQIPAFGSASQFAQAYQDVPEAVITVEAGDSLYSIAQKVLGNGSAWKYIWKSNQDQVPNPNLLSPGQVLRFKDYRNAPQASL